MRYLSRIAFVDGDSRAEKDEWFSTFREASLYYLFVRHHTKVGGRYEGLLSSFATQEVREDGTVVEVLPSFYDGEWHEEID